MFRLVLLTCVFVLTRGASLGPIPSDQSRIIGGELVDISQAPWHTAILQDHSDGVIYFMCSGTLIGTKYVLTSATCIEELDVTTLRLSVGSNLFHIGGMVYNVSNVIINPNYNYSDNDIAVMISSIDILTGDLVKPALLPAQDFNIPLGSIGNFTGWGFFNSNLQLSTSLRKVELAVIDNEICRSYFENNISERMLCIDGFTKGPCPGDEGGPLTIDGIVVGVSGYGRSCLGSGYPTVFARVSSFTDWIISLMQ